MKTLILVFLLVIGSSCLKAQYITYTKDCDFLGPLHYKNGKVTVIIKATYKDLYRSPEEGTAKELQKKNKLRYKDYFQSCCGGTCIGFTPDNCSKEYGATMFNKIKFDINHFRVGDTFYLTCVVFDMKRDSKYVPFFVINNISLTKP